jgi:hypothetical protein
MIRDGFRAVRNRRSKTVSHFTACDAALNDAAMA